MLFWRKIHVFGSEISPFYTFSAPKTRHFTHFRLLAPFEFAPSMSVLRQEMPAVKTYLQLKVLILSLFLREIGIVHLGNHVVFGIQFLSFGILGPVFMRISEIIIEE